jgi:Na+-driven multidrug efflux pump
VANVTLNYVLITEYGVIGTAVATLLSGLLRNAIQVCEIAYWYDITPSAPNNLAVSGVTGIGMIGLILTTGEVSQIIVALTSILLLGACILPSATKEEKKEANRIFARIT